MLTLLIPLRLLTPDVNKEIFHPLTTIQWASLIIEQLTRLGEITVIQFNLFYTCIKFRISALNTVCLC